MNGEGFAPLTRATRQTVIERVERDSAFTVALHDEVATLFLSGEPEIARSILHDLVNVTSTIDECDAIAQYAFKCVDAGHADEVRTP